MAAPKKPRAPRKPKAPKLTDEQKEQRRWQKAAERERDRALKKHPLLVYAGLVKLPTPEEKRARHEAYMAKRELEEQAKEAEEVARVSEARAVFVAIASPEQIAALDGVLGSFPRSFHPKRYEEAVRELQGLPDPVAAHQADYKTSLDVAKQRRQATRAKGPMMPSLFPGENERRVEAARARGDDPTHVDGEEGPPPPCTSCGWDRVISTSKLAFNLHPDSCPARRGLHLGMGRNCSACKALRHGCCPSCLEAVVTCDREGHLPHWPTKPPYIVAIGRPTCSHCDVTLPLESMPQRAA